MKIKILNAILWDGEHREVGDVFELQDQDAINLINRGRAVAYSEPAAIDTNRAVGVTKSGPDNVTKRKSYKRKTSD